MTIKLLWKYIMNWSEVWALFIPIFILLKHRRQPAFLKPVAIYLWSALVIFLAADIIMAINDLGPVKKYSNNFLYNIHSIARFICFSSFFILLKQPFLSTIKKILPALSLLFVLINFIFFEDFFARSISSRLFATESGLLLFYCLAYYLFKLQEENVGKRLPDFWIVTGLSIYVIFNFPFFLLYTSLNGKDQAWWWDFHNYSYIILCIFIAKAFYAAGNRH